MKKLNKLFIIFVTLIFGCSIRGTNWNDHIDVESRSQIKSLNDKIIESFVENNPTKLKEILSNKLKEKMSTELDPFVARVHLFFREKRYKILDEYLTNASGIGTVATVFKSTSDENAYKVIFEVLNKETYISLLINDNDSIGKRELVTCIYGRYNDTWKINVLKVADYSYFEKNAIDFYKQAKINYAKGNLIDVVDDLVMVQQTATPADQYFQYQKETEMKDFSTKVMTEIKNKYFFPMKISEVKTSPEIFNIRPYAMNEGIFPMVRYLSKIDLIDTVNLKKENEELKKVIGTHFYGIDSNKKYVFFQAYNQIPNGQTPEKSYGFALATSEK